MSIEAMKQLREVHAIQGKDGCWDIDDYMLGMFNGLELALSIMESRATKYKTRKEFEQTQKQEPVAVVVQVQHPAAVALKLKADIPVGTSLYTSLPQRQPLMDEEIAYATADVFMGGNPTLTGIARAIEAAHGIKEEA